MGFSAGSFSDTKTTTLVSSRISIFCLNHSGMYKNKNETENLHLIPHTHNVQRLQITDLRPKTTHGAWGLALYNVKLWIARNLLETRENIKIKSHPFYHIIYDWFSWRWIDPWVSRINWCEGHWCGSTYIAVRLSDIGSKRA